MYCRIAVPTIVEKHTTPITLIALITERVDLSAIIIVSYRLADALEDDFEWVDIMSAAAAS